MKIDYLLQCAVTFLAVAYLALFSPETRALNSAPPPLLAYPPTALPHLHFGYSETFADALWIRAIQDFDYCEQSTKQISALPNPLEDNSPLPPPRCREAWVFQMIDAVTTLAPKFKAAFVIGGTFLSVFVEDREGAMKIFKKALEAYPENWELHYRVGYHYLYELRNLENAAFHLKRAAELGAPPWVYALSARIYSKTGQTKLGIIILEEALRANRDGPGAERIRYRLEILRAELSKAEATTGSPSSRDN